MTFTTTITQKGQMTLPKTVQEVLHLLTVKGVEISLAPAKKALKINPVPDFFSLAGYLDTFIPPSKRIDPVKAREYMENNYERV